MRFNVIACFKWWHMIVSRFFLIKIVKSSSEMKNMPPSLRHNIKIIYLTWSRNSLPTETDSASIRNFHLILLKRKWLWTHFHRIIAKNRLLIIIPSLMNYFADAMCEVRRKKNERNSAIACHNSKWACIEWM